MNLRNILKHRNMIYGFLAIWIVLFHINRRLGEPIQIPVLSQLLLCGNMAVDIFMFLSGCCLFLSMDKRPDVKEFYQRRLFRLLPSYFFITVPFWFWRSLIEAPRVDGGFHYIRFLADLSSSTFWLKGIETTWFVHAILLFYLLFPLVFKVIKRGLKEALVLLVAVYVLNLIAIEFIPIYECSSIAWTRLPIFIIGTIAGKYIDYLDLKRVEKKIRIFLVGGSTAIFTLSLFVFPLSSLFTREDVKSEYLWMLYGPLTVCFLVVLSFVLREREIVRKSQKNPMIRAFDTIGKMSLELYMTHIIILHWFTYYGILEIMGLWAFLVIYVLSFLWSVLTCKIVSWMMGKARSEEIIKKVI